MMSTTELHLIHTKMKMYTFYTLYEAAKNRCLCHVSELQDYKDAI